MTRAKNVGLNYQLSIYFVKILSYSIGINIFAWSLYSFEILAVIKLCNVL